MLISDKLSSSTSQCTCLQRSLCVLLFLPHSDSVSNFSKALVSLQSEQLKAVRLMESKADVSKHFVLCFLSACGFSAKWFHFHEGKHLVGTRIKYLFLDLKFITASDSQTKAEESIFIVI